MLKTYLRLAGKGFKKFRKRRRNLTLLLIGAFFILIVTFSLFASIFANQQSYWGDLMLGSGVITVDEVDYEVTIPPDHDEYFSYTEVKESLSADILFTPRLRVGAILEGFDSETEKNYSLWGVDVEQELALTPKIFVIEGRFPEEGAREIALFPQGAGILDVRVGDQVIIYVNTVDGYPNYDLVEVVGFLSFRDARVHMYAHNIVYTSLNFLQDLKLVAADQVSEVLFRTDSFFDSWQINRNLPEDFQRLAPQESIGMYYAITELYGFFKWLIFFLVLAVVISAVYHNISLIIKERLREIGVYITYGAKKGWVIRLWLFELTLYLLYCSLWGLVLAFLFGWLLNTLEIYAINEVFNVLLGGPLLRVNLGVTDYLQSFGLIWMIVFLATLKQLGTEIKEGKIISLLTR